MVEGRERGVVEGNKYSVASLNNLWYTRETVNCTNTFIKVKYEGGTTLRVEGKDMQGIKGGRVVRGKRKICNI